MAVALFSIEKQLGSMAETEKKIVTFLETEKEAEIEANVQTLGKIIAHYKYNWDNEPYMASNHKMLIDIKAAARKNIIYFQKQTEDTAEKKEFLVAKSKVNTAMEDLLKKFRYYRMALYTFSMASLTEVMLSGNFKEDYITEIRDEIEDYSAEYRRLYSNSSELLEKRIGASVEKNVLKGLGAASDKVGKIIGKIPVIEKGPVDEFLQDSGERMKQSAADMETETVAAFAEVKDPATSVFIEKLEDMAKIYNHTKQICFDKENIYLIA